MERFSEPMNSCIVVFQRSGIFPFQRRRGRLVIFKRVMLVYCCFMVSVAFVFVFTYYYPLRRINQSDEAFSEMQQFFEIDESQTAAVVYKVVMVAVLSFCFCWLCDVFFNRVYLDKFFSALDYTPQLLGRVNFRLTRGMKGILLMMFNVFVSCLYCTLVLGLNVSTYGWVGFLFLMYSTALPHLCFVSIIDRYLELMTSLFNAPQIILRDKCLQNLVNIYDTLCTAVDHLNGYYGRQLFIIIVCCCAGITANVFFTTKMFSEPQYYNAIFMAIVYCSALGHLVFVLAEACSSLTHKAEKFNKLLSTCALQDKTKQRTTNPYIAMHFISRKKPEFNICGCFKLDVQLLCSMVAACVTYLVILVQIDGSKNIT